MNEKKEMNEKEEKKDVSSALQEVYVDYDYVGHFGQFDLPRGIVNYYELSKNDALLCELVELRKSLKENQEDVKKIGKDILVDIISNTQGEFPRPTMDLYDMGNYKYALLKIKSVIHD